MPDPSKFTLDKTSGYLYDSATGLYYDPNSLYYWNSVIQKYMYYNTEKMTYMLAPVSFDYNAGGSVAQSEAAVEPETKKPKPEKQDKVKVAKKIAKDMERWAKTLNQKKETAVYRTNSNSSDYSVGLGIGSADIGFSVLEKKATNPVLIMGQASVLQPDTTSQAGLPPASTPLVAAYGESESSEDESTDEPDFLDFTKMICNLCKRQLPSSEALDKHSKLSDLHKKNLEAFRSNAKNNSANSASKPVYRDRAKERRMKYGVTDDPQPSKLKEKYLKSRELAETAPSTSSAAAEPIGVENVGNRLLQKMGWTEGQGLGKSNQGRTTIIEVNTFLFLLAKTLACFAISKCS